MGQTTGTILVVILVAIVLVGVIFFFSPQEEEPTVLEPATPIEATLPDEVVREAVTAKHQFKDGMHIIVGEIELPTPCHMFDTNIIVRESFPEQVTLEFIATAKEGIVCAQVITPQPFTAEFTASERALITATVNNDPVALNLIKIEEGEDLEVFIEG